MTKPFKVIIDDDSRKESIEPRIAPRTFEPDPELDRIVTPHDEEVAISIQSSSLQKIIRMFASLSGVLLSLLLLLFIALLAATIDSLGNLLQAARLSDYLYITGLLVLLFALLMNLASNFRQLRQLKDISRLKQGFNRQQDKPTEEILALSNELLAHLSKNKTAELQKSLDETRQKIHTTQDYYEIYHTLNNTLLAPLDEKARSLIKNASLQAAFSTAISPVPLIDVFIIIWRGFKLTTDIARLYGYRSGGLTSIMLLKKGMINVVFAGVSELTLQLTNEITSASVVHKISYAAGQGIVNGILLARFGYGMLEACRPLPLSERRENIIKTIVESMLKSFKTKEETKA